MNTPLKTIAIVLAIAAALAAGYGLGHWRGMGAMPMAAGPTADAGPAAAGAAPSAADGRNVLYWYDPMVPQQRFDKPGKSPFMDMQLVPKYADEGGGAPGVRIDPALAQSLGMRLATVTRSTQASSVEAFGVIGFNERDVAVVQARAAGFVERVPARAPGDLIAAGATLAEVLVPEWVGAQQEYLVVRRTGEATLTAAARQRLLLLGMSDALIRDVESRGRPRGTTAITSPIGGVVQEMAVRSGMSLAPGMTLARINGLGTMWLEVAVPEVQGALLQPGRSVAATLAAFPGETFSGRIAAVLPEASSATRSLRVRIELPNRGGRLKAGMYAQARIEGASRSALVVPAEAVIRTGQRALVYVAGEGGKYRPVEVQLGREFGDQLEIVSGVAEGQQVVASGQFLVDSEASLSGLLDRAAPQPAVPGAATGPGPAAPAAHEGEGVIAAVGADALTIAHGPVASMQWGAMTMPFKATAAQKQGLDAGARVRFRFHAGDGGYVLDEVQRAPAGPAGAASAGATMAPAASAAPARPAAQAPAAAPAAAVATHEGSGVIEAVGADALTIAHGPVASLQWGAMTMAFKATPPQRAAVQVGTRVQFRFHAGDGGYVLDAVTPAAGTAPAGAAASAAPTGAAR